MVEGVHILSPSIESGRGTATGAIVPEKEVRMESPLSRMTMKSDNSAIEARVDAVCNCLLGKSVCYKTQNKQFKLLILEKEAEVTDMSTYLREIEKMCYNRNRERHFAKSKRSTTCMCKIEKGSGYPNKGRSN